MAHATLADTMVVNPGIAVIAWVALAMVMMLLAAITALKAHWSLLILGLVTAGITWVIGAGRQARPGSIWQTSLDLRRRRSQR